MRKWHLFKRSAARPPQRKPLPSWSSRCPCCWLGSLVRDRSREGALFLLLSYCSFSPVWVSDTFLWAVAWAPSPLLLELTLEPSDCFLDGLTPNQPQVGFSSQVWRSGSLAWFPLLSSAIFIPRLGHLAWRTVAALPCGLEPYCTVSLENNVPLWISSGMNPADHNFLSFQLGTERWVTRFQYS